MLRLSQFCFFILGVALMWRQPVAAQESAGDGLFVQGLAPDGLRASVTESWGVLKFTVENTTRSGREARVLVFYSEQPDVQYGRHLWVPAEASLSVWLP